MQEPHKPIFPPDDVATSLADATLQKEHRIGNLEPGAQSELEETRQAAIAGGASASTRWIYFSSPPWTWEQLCGREGWLLYDPATERQLEFVMTVMN
jgi:hypothetical protein